MRACERRASKKLVESETACNDRDFALRAKLSSELLAEGSEFREHLGEVRSELSAARVPEHRAAQRLVDNEAYQSTCAHESTEKAYAERADLARRFRSREHAEERGASPRIGGELFQAVPTYPAHTSALQGQWSREARIYRHLQLDFRFLRGAVWGSS